MGFEERYEAWKREHGIGPLVQPDEEWIVSVDGVTVDVAELADALADRLAVKMDSRPLLTPKTLAQRLAVSERTARQLLIDGVIPSFTVGEPGKETGRRIRPADVDAYIARREVADG